MDVLTASEARASLPAILDRIEAGAEVTITRHGRPVAVVVSPDALQFRRSETSAPVVQRVRLMMEQGRHGPLPPSNMSNERAEELVSHVRRGRSAH
ncbi:MAG: hypothetical protein DLM70_06590 [Chloroflexi bacterium]|nr:MAG: hypothetical protein DLM70_06590 [Chloroflexota bacterium]